MLETLAVFQFARGWLKAIAEMNICEPQCAQALRPSARRRSYAEERAACATAASKGNPDN
jgi:hypothetical protein